MLRTIFCALPAFSLVEPAITSGPTTGTILISAAFVIGDPGTHVTATLRAPSSRAYLIAPTVYGVLPEAATPTSASSFVNRRWRKSSAPAFESSSEASTAWWQARNHRR